MTESQSSRTDSTSTLGRFRSVMFTRNRYTNTIKVVFALALLVAAGAILVRGDKIPWLVEAEASDQPINEVVQAIATGDGDRLYEAVQQMRRSPKFNNRRTIALLLALELGRMDLPEKDEGRVIATVERLFPPGAIGKTADAEAYASIAGGLWEAGAIDAAVRQSQALTKTVAQSWKEEQSGDQYPAIKRIIRGIATGIQKSPALDGDGRAAAQDILRELAGHCVPRERVISESRFDAAASLIGALVAVGNRDTAVSYYGQWLEHAAQAGSEKELIRLAESVADSGSRLIKTPAQVNAFLGVLLATMQAAPDANVGEAWTRFAAAAEDRVRDQTYRRLLAINHSAALDAAAQMLPDPPLSAPLDEIRRDHFQWMAMDMAHLVRSPAFGHLVAVFQDRNAEAELDQLTRFLWIQFPRQWIGAQAFTTWASRQTPDDGLARAAAMSRRMRHNYGQAPIARVARLTMARAAAAEGHTLQALVEVAELSDSESIDPETQLSFDLAQKLIDNYQKELASHHVTIDPGPLYLGLGEQLYAAGEPALAAALYWQSRQALDQPYVDPRIDEPMPTPNLTRAGRSTSQATSRFWRAIALAGVGRQSEAIDELNLVAANFPNMALADLARFALVEQLIEAGQIDQARQQLARLPAVFADSKAGQKLKEQLAQAPK